LSDFTLAPANTLICGMTGSGKTTFALRYLLNAPAACRFIFDDLGRAATRLRLRPCYTASEVEAALATRWVVWNPHRMFPGDTKAAFRWFCSWVYDASRRGPGKKLFLVDELWQWCTDESIPRELAIVSNTGREEHIELVTATQHPQLVNAAITGACTELVCFRLNEPDALRTVAKLGANRDAIQALPLGSFASYDRLKGAVELGRVF
jgi:hypothetical protein